jgi:hypothetical protein
MEKEEERERTGMTREMREQMRHTHAHTHRHTQTHTDTHRHTQTHTLIFLRAYKGKSVHNDDSARAIKIHIQKVREVRH